MTPAWHTQLAPRAPVAIVRLDDLAGAAGLAKALLQGGICAIEFTLTNTEALAAIEQVRDELGDQVFVGAGTVLDAQAARAALDAGAQFLVTPMLALDVVQVARAAGVPVICGAFTPTEIFTAWRSEADLIKVFPARSLGPTYIKDVLAPLPQLRLVPTGGVDLENCAAFLAAGAYTVALGSNLVDPRLVARQEWDELARRARAYVERCAEPQPAPATERAG